MKVCFCLEGPIDPVPYIRMAGLMVDSVKKAMPGIEIIQHTDMQFPAVQGVTVQRRSFPGDHVERRWRQCAEMKEPFISLDADVIVRRELSGVFDLDFDVAMCRTPDRPDHVYNAGVIFCKRPSFFHEVIRTYRTKTTMDGWEDSQTAITIAANSAKVLDLPFDVYNYTPKGPGEGLEAAIVHYRGLRKHFMAQDCGVEEIKFPIVGFETAMNTSAEVMIINSEINLARDLPLFAECPVNGNKALIVGGGPSLISTLPNLRMKRNYGGIVFALNGTHDFLIDRRMVPDFHVLLDAREENVQFVQKPHKDVTYLIASCCHPSVFDALKNHQVITWIPCLPTHAMDQGLANRFPHTAKTVRVGGMATVGLRTMNIAHIAGFRNQHLYGFDSSYDDGEHHAYSQSLNDSENRMVVSLDGRNFVCAPWMAKQAVDFQKACRLLEKEGTEIHVHGYGLIPYIAQQWAKQQEAA